MQPSVYWSLGSVILSHCFQLQLQAVMCLSLSCCIFGRSGREVVQMDSPFMPGSWNVIAPVRIFKNICLQSKTSKCLLYLSENLIIPSWKHAMAYLDGDDLCKHWITSKTAYILTFYQDNKSRFWRSFTMLKWHHIVPWNCFLGKTCILVKETPHTT